MSPARLVRGPWPGPVPPVPATARQLRCDLLVIGAGAAGLATALAAADQRPDARIVLVTRVPPGDGGASVWAQGGVAVALGDDDGPALHAADTLAVAVGLADPAAVGMLTREGRRRMRALIARGARFDRDASGELLLGREAAHSRSRIVHADGDATGRELVRALGAAVATSPAVEVVVGEATRLLVAGGAVGGARIVTAAGVLEIAAPATVLATGGVGQLWRSTTNPLGANGSGLALAGHAGALLVDLEMVQFHPTALAVDADPLPLISEAVRGEGAWLLDGAGRRFMPAVHPLAELAPRDVVARAVFARVAAGERVFLDARAAVGERFPARFPSIFASCREHGIDPRRDLIPVSPAAHYHMGGVLVDRDGRSSLPGLWAAGEVASSGVHGANRLASNSLLEALVWGARAGESALRSTGEEASPPAFAAIPAAPAGLRSPSAAHDPAVELGSRADLRDVMERLVGVERDAAGLDAAVRWIESTRATVDEEAAVGGVDTRAPEAPEPTDAGALLAAGAIAAAALARRESRGSHQRRDYPQTDPAQAHRLLVACAADGVPAVIGTLAPGAPLRRRPGVERATAPGAERRPRVAREARR